MARRFRDLPLAAKFTLLTALILTVTLGASSGYLIKRQQQLIEGQLRSKAESLGRFFALIAPETILAFDFSTLDDYVAEITTRPDMLFAMVSDANGQPLTTFVDPAKRLMDRADSASGDARMEQIRNMLAQSHDVLLLEFPIAHGNDRLGQLYVAVDLLPSMEEAARMVRRQGLLYLGGIVLLSTLIFFVFRHNVLQPVHALVRGAQRVSKGDFEQPVKRYAADEMGRLTEVFNDMMRRIHEEREELRKLSRAVEQSPASVIITDIQGAIEYVNPTFTRITGYPPEEAVGQNPSLLKSGKTPPDLYTEMWNRILGGEVWVGELCNRKKNGELYWENVTIAPIKNDEGTITHFIALKEDISLRKDYEEQLFQQANFDPLTNLPNRALSQDRLKQALNQARRADERVAVLFIDLDNFKTVNDTLGHATGDELLRRVAALLQEQTRDGDTLARLGGDEFLLVMDDVGTGHPVEAVCQRIIDSLSRPITIDNHELQISSSIGITLFPEDGDRCDTLLKNADTAMYQAKAEGRNTYHFYTPELNENITHRLRMENELRRALERNELEVYYQPIVDADSESPIMAEALLRWHNDLLGEISPGEFIPLAEEIGEIVPIGAFVLRQATAQLARWQERYGLPQRIAVNLSARQFARGDIGQQVSEALAQSGIAPASLELEITEGLLLDKAHGCDRQLGDLKALGVTLSIDDFGTGYSALSYLKEYPLDTLKIDRSFVVDIHTDGSECNLIRAIVAMAEGLDLEVIAEGVETEVQHNALRNMNVRYLQGFRFSRPLPADEFARTLLAHR